MQQVLEKSETHSGGRNRERLFDTGEAWSLDDVVSRLSQSLTVRGDATCLVCGATFVRAPEGTSVSAECTSCGSRFE
jgi:hypothetical protein